MRWRLGRIVALVMVAVLALGGMAWAQEEGVTLESLAGMVAAIDERVGALEGIFADPWSPEIIYTDDGVCQNPLHGRGQYSNYMEQEIHQETADAYRASYGISIDPERVHLRGISFGMDSNDLYLEYFKDGRAVVETWAHCEFLGHSEWAVAE